MDILQAIQRLRDDLKLWVTNNLNFLSAKIDEKTILVDNELDSTSTNPVQNKVITEAINNIPRFSGDYNDLENAPDISEDDSGDLIIADKEGNIIFRSNGDGFETVNLIVQNITVNGVTIQEMIKAYVDENFNMYL
jgi:hypothetical protein